MAGMDFKDIQNLIRLISRSDLAEFKMKDGEFELSIRTQHFSKAKEKETFVQPMPVNTAPQTVVQPASPGSTPDLPASEGSAEGGKPAGGESNESNLLAIKSPIVGTFYRSSSPEKPPYVKVGDVISAGDVVCIVEAMKLFNEIESEISGKIVKVLVDDASPVEYDQVLYLVDPKG